MQNKSDDIKFKHFDNLPEEAKAVVPSHLPIRTFLNLASTSKQYYTFYDTSNFYKSLDKCNPFFKPIYDLGYFLYCAVRRRDEEVKKGLKNDITLICKKGLVTDCSYRTFNISAFEYAFWARDKHFWTLMLDCIPHNKVGIAIIEELITQLENIEKHRITYELKVKTKTGEFQIKTITEKHFDFENTIIKELQEYVNMVKKDKVNWNEADIKWCKGVGQAQNLFPMHVVHEYCADRPFDPVPDFKLAPKELKQQLYNYTVRPGRYEHWFAIDSGRGFSFAVYKAGLRRAALGGARGAGGLDLSAIKALCEERTKDCGLLRQQLEGLLLTITQSLENQPCLNG